MFSILLFGNQLTMIIGVSCTVFPSASVPPPFRVKIFCEVVCVLPIWRSSVSLLNFLQKHAFQLNCKQLSIPQTCSWPWFICGQNIDHLPFTDLVILEIIILFFRFEISMEVLWSFTSFISFWHPDSNDSGLVVMVITYQIRNTIF